MNNMQKMLLAEACYDILIKWCPVDTGAMSNMIYINIRDDGFELVIPAYYTVYTNETWIRRKGINPNEAWIQNAFVEIYEYLTKRLNQIHTRVDFDNYVYLNDVEGMIGGAVVNYNINNAPHSNYSSYNRS